MYCFYLMYKVTREETCIYGYTLQKAMKKAEAKLNQQIILVNNFAKKS